MKIKRSKAEAQEARRCEGGRFWRRLESSNVHSINACHFLLDTGKMRGMSVQDCTRKVMVIPA